MHHVKPKEKKDSEKYLLTAVIDVSILLLVVRKGASHPERRLVWVDPEPKLKRVKRSLKTEPGSWTPRKEKDHA
jgi:hypothetical protein